MILRLNDVKKRIGLSKSTIYRLEKNNQFPNSFKLGERAIAWDESEINDWIASKKKASQENRHGGKS